MGLTPPFAIILEMRSPGDLQIIKRYKGTYTKPLHNAHHSRTFYPGIFTLFCTRYVWSLKRCSCVFCMGKQPDPAARRPVGKLPLRIENTTKKMRNENELMRSFCWISWHRSLLLRGRSLMRGQLPSFPYVTWLSLPFQWFFVHCGFCHKFMFFWYRDIRFVPMQEFKRF